MVGCHPVLLELKEKKKRTKINWSYMKLDFCEVLKYPTRLKIQNNADFFVDAVDKEGTK